MCPGGISKDNPDRLGYDVAKQRAVQASINYINQILNDPAVATNPQAIKALMDVPSTLGFAIDDTASMQSALSAVKPAVQNIVFNLVGTEKEPARYLLERFGDPDVGPPLVTPNSGDFLAALSALQAHEGGDCEELSLSALLQAISVSQTDATLHLYTDADPKDANLEPEVIRQAKGKRIIIYPHVYGNCTTAGIHPAYKRIAESTGGKRVASSPTAAGDSAALVRAALLSDGVQLLSVNGNVNGDVRQFQVPVDSTVSSFTSVFSCAVEGICGPVSLLRPSGVAVQPTDPGVTITSIGGHAFVITVDSPEPGLWAFQGSGFADFSFQAMATSDLRFDRFEFVALAGRPGHEGLFPVQDEPVAPGPHTGLASLLGPFQTATFRLVSLTGATLQTIELSQGNPNAAAEDFVGQFTIPARPFRVAVSGVTTGSQSYQRVFPAMYGPAPFINPGGVVNAASFAAGAPVAAGSIAAVFGTNLALETASAPSTPLPTTLGEAQMVFNADSPAPLFFTSPNQVNIQIPWNLNQAYLTDNIEGLPSAPITVSLAPFAPGIFTPNSQGTGQGSIVIASGPNAGVLAAPVGALPGSRPVVRGSEYISIYCTGLGEVTNQPASGSPALSNPLSHTTTTPVVTIGGVQATVTFSGRTPTLVGLYQVNALVPATAPIGDNVPVQLSIGSALSNTVTIAVQ